MDYSKIGNHLRLVRERKGLSHEQIFEITRIQPSILRGIEEGKASIAPGFLKGFIKTYARSLGLDLEDIFNQLEKENQQKEALKEETKKPSSDSIKKQQSYLKYVFIFSWTVYFFSGDLVCGYFCR